MIAVQNRLAPITQFRDTHTTRKTLHPFGKGDAGNAQHYRSRKPALRSERAVETNQAFEQVPIRLKQGLLFDLGVVDANNDDIFDIFTTNHYATESLLLGSSSEKFTDVLSQWKLDQDQQFPGLGDLDFHPPSTKGLYVYRRNGEELHLQLKKGKNIKPISGTIDLPSPRSKNPSVFIQRRRRTDVSIQDDRNHQEFKTRIKFKIRPNGRLVLNTRFISIPYSIKLDKSFPLSQVYVGARQIHPDTHKFTFHLHDRHGMAWADYEGDSDMDVFMSRGGLRGQILNFPHANHIRDELFINQGNALFQDRAARLGFAKQGCRARKAAWVDFNQDNRLDLYVAGFRSPNQLFQQQPNGYFKNVAEKQGVNFHDSGSFEWIHADNDGDLDLLVVRQGKLMLYKNQRKRLNLYQNISTPSVDFRKLAVADYDQDGDFDIYAASPQSSKLLINTGGRYKALNPAAVGLPTQTLTANWVDYDNDGLVDLHTIPGNLYRQTPDHQFVATHLLNQDFPSSTAGLSDPNVQDARSAWFDLDNNGTRDALYFIKQQELNRSSLYRNLLVHNHWLQLKLTGPQGNRQAIGAKVAVITPNFKQVQQVGQSEGSHYSQGHYRLYFGLGQHQGPGSIQITWTDGTRQDVQFSNTDQLLTVQYRQP